MGIISKVCKWLQRRQVEFYCRHCGDCYGTPRCQKTGKSELISPEVYHLLSTKEGTEWLYKHVHDKGNRRR